MVSEKAQLQKDKMKAVFDKRTKSNTFNEGDLVLRWDARWEDKPKHGKFDNLWFVPFKIVINLQNNTFILTNLNDEQVEGGLVNGRFLKHFFS